MSIVHAKFSLADYHRMIDAGILDHRKVELIEGEIVEMSPSGPPHIRAIMNLLEAFAGLVAAQHASLLCQSGLAIPDQDSCPEPDLALVTYGLGRSDNAIEATQAFAVIEVADSTLATDRRVKLPLYARAGIAEFWIVNLIDDCIEVYRAPDQTSGTYSEKRIVRRGESVCLLAFPDFEVAGSAILPRKEAP
ncbi:MAG: Uma2 family endonuclease [Sumerlaeia bacterium]